MPGNNDSSVLHEMRVGLHRNIGHSWSLFTGAREDFLEKTLHMVIVGE